MKAAVANYGMDNLHSVLKSVQATQNLPGKTTGIHLINCPEDVSTADKITFPRQDVMPDCMVALRKSGLDEVVADGLEDKLFSGICVSTQLLFERSEEGGIAELGRFKSRVRRSLLSQTNVQGNRLKAPYTGWNTVHQTRPHSLLKDITPSPRFYFAHDCYFTLEDPDVVLGISKYPHEFAYVIDKDNVLAIQLRMEESHDVGLLPLCNFLDWSDG